MIIGFAPRPSFAKQWMGGATAKQLAGIK